MYEHTIERSNERGTKETGSGWDNRRGYKKRDSKAFTEAGKIKTYNIDYDKTYYNPMGGIEVIIYVNGNQNLKLQYTVVKTNNKYEIGSGSGSEELAKLLKEENK